MSKQINKSELEPEPANEEIFINLSSFYEFGKYALSKQHEYTQTSHHNVQGFYVKGNTYGATLGKCRKVDEGKEKTIDVEKKRLDVVESLTTIAEFCISRGLPAFLIEISIYDARDDDGNQFYTYVYSQSSKILSSYIKEIQNNIDLSKDENSQRGLILPSSSFYTYPYFATQVNGKISPAMIDPHSSKPLIFVGGFNIMKDKSTSRHDIKGNTINFMDCILKKSTKETLLSESEESLLGVVIPIVRPVSILQVKKESENNSEDSHRFNGGGIFIYGVPTDEFKLSDFVLRLKTDLLEKALMRESFSATDHYKNSRDTAVNDFSHEMKHVLSALQGGWLREPSDIFDIVHSPVNNITTGSQKIGCIEIYDKERFDINAIRIVPLPQLVKNIRRLGFLWTGSYNPQDLPFELSIENNEVFLSEIIHKTWIFMIEIAVTSLLFKSEPSSSDTIQSIRRTYEFLISIFPSIIVEGEENFTKKLKVKWGNRDAIDKVMSIVRIFASIFANATNYIDVSYGYFVEFSKHKKGVKIVLKNQAKTDDVDNIKAIARRLCSSRMSNYSLEEIESKLLIIKDLKLQSERVGIDGYHTNDVIDGLKQCAGVFSYLSQEFPNDPDDRENGSRWETEIVLSI